MTSCHPQTSPRRPCPSVLDHNKMAFAPTNLASSRIPSAMGFRRPKNELGREKQRGGNEGSAIGGGW